MQSIPTPPYPPEPTPIAPRGYVPYTAAEKVEQARKALADAEAALALKEAQDARKAELDDHIMLCILTRDILASIQNFEQSGAPFYASPALASRREYLREIADEYGYKIVLVGDKKSAMLVQK